MSAWVSSAEGDRQVAVVGLDGRVVLAVGVVLSAVRSLFVVEAEEGGKVGLDLDLGAVALEVDLLVFDRAGSVRQVSHICFGLAGAEEGSGGKE